MNVTPARFIPAPKAPNTLLLPPATMRLLALLSAALLTTVSCGGDTTAPSTGALGEACRDGNVCEGSLVCDEGICIDPIPEPSDASGDVSPDTSAPVDAEEDAEAEDVAPEVLDDAIEEDAEEGPEETEVEDSGCQSPADCADAFEDIPNCQVPTCDTSTGECILAVAPDEAPCDDANPCSYNDACTAGVCAGIGGDCDDGNPCTADKCGTDGCENTPEVGPCDDGNFCTTDDFCIGGTCLGDPVTCDDGPETQCLDDQTIRAYESVGVCDANTGICDFAFQDVNCIEGCVNDACASNACEVAGAGAPCDDGLLCTENDLCTAGGDCVGTPTDCSGLVDGCNDATCDVTEGGCKLVPLVTGTECDDGDACTLQEVCSEGTCIVTADKECDDNNPCTDDTCDSATGECVILPNQADCDDGDPCTEGDLCSGGFCLSADKDCDDGDPCTDDSCLAGACVHTPNTSPCDDGDICTDLDTCGTTGCVGVPKLCEDGNPCTDEVCEADVGCVTQGFNSSALPCYDGDDASASVGVCTAGARTCTEGVLGPCLGQVLPSAEQCETLADEDCDGDIDEPDCVAPPSGIVGARLDWTLDADAPGMLIGNPADLNNGGYQQTLGSFNTKTPASVGKLKVSAGTLEAEAFLSAQPRPPAMVDGIIRTPEVHIDAPEVRALVQVRDDAGRNLVAGGSATMRLLLPGQPDVTGVCYVGPGSTCEASATVPDSWFSESSSVLATVRFELPNGEKSDVQTLSLAQAAAYDPWPDPGVVVQLPQGAQYPNDTFTVPVYAHATDSFIESFDLAVGFDPSVLSVMNVSIDSRYNGVQNPKVDEVLIVGVREVDTAFEDVTGVVQIAEIVFQVLDSAAAGDTSAITLEVTSLFNTQSVALFGPSATYASVIEDGSGSGTVGSVQVKGNTIQGIYAKATQNELFNTSGLSSQAEPVTSAIEVFTVRAYPPDSEVSGNADCVSQYPAVLKVNDGCVATLDTSTTSPSDDATVTVEYEGHSAEQPFVVWQPLFPVSLSVGDNFLERITGLKSGDCSEDIFQSTTIAANVSFTSNTSQSNLIAGRLEHLLEFVSYDPPDVLLVEGNRVQGLKAGFAEVVAMGPSGPIGTASVVVSGTAVDITELDVIVPTHITFDGFTPPSPFFLDGTAVAQATLTQNFDFEGVSGPVLVYAKMSDGKTMDVTGHENVTVTSLAPTTIAIEADPYRAVALDSGSGDMVSAVLESCDEEVASGAGFVEVALPAPVAAEVNLTSDAIARAPDDAAYLAGLPLCASLNVELEYETGETKNFTLDSRTFYDDQSGDPFDLFYLDTTENADGEVIDIQVCTTSGINYGAFALIVSFTHAPELGDIIVPVNIVKADGLTTVAHPWPAFPGSTDIDKTTFQQIEGTGAYQRGIIEAQLALSDGTTVDVSANPSTSYTLELIGAGAIEGVMGLTAPNFLDPKGPGTVQVEASFGDRIAPPLALGVQAAGVLAESLALNFPTTFKGFTGIKQQALEVTATFQDGTVLSNAQDIPGFFFFESSRPEAATISSSGLATLHDNHNRLITLSATSTTTGLSASVETACNLDPLIGDVDLGKIFDIAHPDVLPGENFEMPVRINTGNDPLGALDLTINYDPAVIQAVGYEPGAGWPGGQLEATLNDPPGTIRIVGAASVGSTAKGNALEVMRLKFLGLKGEETNVTLIDGVIRKLLTNAAEPQPIGDALDVGETRAIVAGRGDLDPDCPNGLAPSDIIGNADGDCEFSIADVSYGLYYLAELLEGAGPTGAQLSHLDADKNTKVDVADVVYLVRVLAGKFRFASLEVTEAGGVGGATGLEVTLLDANGQPTTSQAKVWLELITEVHKDMELSVGTLEETLPNGLVVELVPTVDGTFAFEAVNLNQTDTVGVNIIVETEDGLGETAEDRLIALHGSTWLNPGTQVEPYAYVTFGTDEEPLCLPGGCNDNNPCTNDTCDPATGCVYTNNEDFCDDGDECTAPDKCQNGVCAGTPLQGCGEAFCGDDICSPDESCETCAYDCGPCAAVCGNGSCDGEESCETCATDCGDCGGDCCLANGSPGCEDPALSACVCALDSWCCTASWDASCANKALIDCGADCGGCGNGVCNDDENCVTCSEDCACSCGDGICSSGAGEDCNTCQADCGECVPFCGDGTCNAGEQCEFCPADCGVCPIICGDGKCDDVEKCNTCDNDPDCTPCEADCGECGPYCGDGQCHEFMNETCASCQSDCGECGGDCCAAHDGVGCDEPSVNDCTCEQDATCCTLEWSDLCVVTAFKYCNSGCKICGDEICSPEIGESCETCNSDCGYCDYPVCGDGVCSPQTNAGVCSNNSDLTCIADSECDGGTCTGYDPGETCQDCPQDCGNCSTGSCCEDNSAICASGGDCGGCVEPSVMSCVCETMAQPYCCGTKWDAGCVNIAATWCNPTCEYACGDGICTQGDPLNPIETCLSCESDCGACEFTCGDDICDLGETCESCQDDCGPCLEDCGDGVCGGIENCAICTEDCGACAATCPDGTGNGTCEAGETPANCPTDCVESSFCGDNICNSETESATSCPEDCFAVCEDGACTDGETCISCPADCGACPTTTLCGDGVCAGTGGTGSGEDCNTCPEDCSLGCQPVCTLYPECGASCNPVSEFFTCGDNLVCAPTATDEDTGSAQYWVTPETTGTGMCGIGCTASGDCANGEVCMPLSGTYSPGVCLSACNPQSSSSCGSSGVCTEVSEATPSVGGCVQSGELCDPSSPIATGCSLGSNRACISVAGKFNVGGCFEHCFATDPISCDGVEGNSFECLPRSGDEYASGTCVGGGSGGCNPFEVDSCQPGNLTDRCTILGGPPMLGLSFYCEEIDANGTQGSACVNHRDCVSAHYCHEGTCKKLCEESEGLTCDPGETCSPAGYSLFAIEDAAFSLCKP